MITICLQGGMGNQMFQYAMGLSQARRLGADFQLDTGGFARDSLRQYNLGLWKGIMEPLTRGSVPSIRETSMPYDQELVNRIKDGDCLFGYWQTEKYFTEVRQQILEVFIPKQPLTRRALDLIEMIQREGQRSAFLTVRRTDYLRTDFHGVLGMDYYLMACQMVAEHTSDPHFFVFSDEPEWCQTNFKLPHRFSIAAGNDQTTPTHLGREDEDLWAMSMCQHAVMANSSYSWWGAWMSSAPDHLRIVTAPRRWFNNAPEDPKDVIPERWRKL